MKKNYLILLLSLSFLVVVNAQQRLSDLEYGTVIENYLARNAAKYKLSGDDLSDLVVSSTTSTQSGLQIAYVHQAYKGILIDNALSTIAVKDNQVFSYANNFISNVASKINTTIPALSPKEAITKVASQYNIGTVTQLAPVASFKPANNKYAFVDATIALDHITTELLYNFDEETQQLQLSWNVGIYTLDAQNFHSVNIDATSGKVLDYSDLVIKCNFGDEHRDHDTHNHVSTTHSADNDFSLFKTGNTAVAENAKFRVFPLPIESPNYGKRSLLTDPRDPKSSPKGWLNEGTSKITKGNNVNAYDDSANKNKPGYQPTANDLNFDFEIDFNADPKTYKDAAITNLFYCANMVHDTFYRYGFDEESGNFQEDNFGKGGSGGDAVNCEAQDGSGSNNANFMTPDDGQPGRMQMYTWSQSKPKRDGDIDNGVVGHEYGHGISTRLTGGRNNSRCLNNKEQMGEGWSDWVALTLTILEGDKGDDAKGMGTYVVGQEKDGKGIRQYKYSTDMKVCPGTYGEIKDYEYDVSPHKTGTVWNTVLWDLTWAYIEKYGFDPDFINGNGGNNRALQVVVDGLKLQQCSPGFVSGRDAILKADMALTDGKDQCMLWEVFARRGLGFRADEGSTKKRNDAKEDFSMPPADHPTLQNCTSTSVNDFSKANYSVYPNPTTGVLSIVTDDNYGDAVVNVVDVNGRVVMSQRVTLTGERLELNIASLTSGVYVLNIQGQSINTFDKIIKN